MAAMKSAFALALLALVAGVASKEMTIAEIVADVTIAEIVASSGTGFDSDGSDFDLLLALVGQAGLVETLGSEGPFTVFAPNDDAFLAAIKDLGAEGVTTEEAAAATLGELLKDLPETALSDLLLYHVVPGKLLSGDVLAAKKFTTANSKGQVIERGAYGQPDLELTDLAPALTNPTIIMPDIMASNGVVHVIDRVLWNLPLEPMAPKTKAPKTTAPMTMAPKAPKCVETWETCGGRGDGKFDCCDYASECVRPTEEGYVGLRCEPKMMMTDPPKTMAPKTMAPKTMAPKTMAPKTMAPEPTCNAPNERCAGAPGYEAIPYIGCCGDYDCMEADYLGWGKFCLPKPVTKAPEPKCTAPNERCAGAPGYKEVPYIGCCGDYDCVEADYLGWGKFCLPKTDAPKCYETGSRCAGAPGYEYVPYAECCSKTAECVDVDYDWGQFCVEKPVTAPPLTTTMPKKTMPPKTTMSYATTMAPTTMAPKTTKAPKTEAPKDYY